MGECPGCPVHHDELRAYPPDGPPGFRDLHAILKALNSFDCDPAGFLQTCARGWHQTACGTILEEPPLCTHLPVHYP